jgi:chromosome segregation ATPase
MDVPALHLLVVTLQNELVEAMSQVRSVSQILGASSGIGKTAVLDECPIDFDVIREYNLLEAKHSELERQNADLMHDYDLLKAQVTLDADITSSGPLRMYDQLKAKLTDANSRIERYYDGLEKMKATIELQQKLMNQFQKEKAAAQRQKSACLLEMSKLKDHVAECEFEVRTVNRKLAAVRTLTRMMAENSLAKRKDYVTSLDNLTNAFYANFERFDSAALLIQRAWRHSKNPRAEKNIIRKEPALPIPELMTMTAIDVIAGLLKPVTYRQVLKLLKSYNLELRDGVLGPLALMRERMARLHKRGNEVAQIVLWRGKRFAWCQTESSRQDRDAQTEGQVRVMPMRAKSRIFNLG